MTVITRPVTREDRVRAVWHGFRRMVEEGPNIADVMLPRLYWTAPRKGSARIIPADKVTLIRWHHRLKPWLYPDGNPMPRFTLRRWLFGPSAANGSKERP